LKIPRFAPILAAVLMALSARAASPIDGSWIGTFMYPSGADLKVIFYFKADGDKVTGKVDSKKGPAPILSGSIKGNEFNFTVSVDGTLIEHECTLSGDTISVKAKFAGQQPSTLTLTRAPYIPPAGPDPTGHWNWTVTLPGADRTYQISANLVFSVGALTGSYHGRFGDAAISDASFKDGVVAFTVAREHEGVPFVLRYRGALSGDTLTGTVDVPPLDGAPASTIAWTASRAN
jgi:hypothetical protein